jgi:putative DNA primase/helicase
MRQTSRLETWSLQFFWRLYLNDRKTMRIEHNFKERSIPAELPLDRPAFVKLRPNSKQPKAPDWQNNPERLEDIDIGKNNIGLLLGERTKLVDIDCDCEEAVHLAGYLLPQPVLHFQRSSSSKHFIYRCHDAGATTQRSHRSSLIELRGTGGQTMIPPSIHPNGDKLEWSPCEGSSKPIAFNDLLRLVNLIAAGCLVMQEYGEGNRHFISLGFAGLLRKAGVVQDQCKLVIKAIAAWNNDDEDRLTNVTSTYRKDINSVAGYKILEGHLGQNELVKICGWLGVSDEVSPLDGEVLDPQDTPQCIQAITSETVSEAVLANNFSREIRTEHCFVPQDRQWRYWDRTRWKTDDRRMFAASFMEFINTQKAKCNDRYLEDELRKFETAYRAESVAKLSQAHCAVEAEKFDRWDNLLNCPNGVLELKTRILKTHNPLEYLTKQTNAAHDSDAQAPRFEQFVLEICDGDKELAGYLQRVSGYALEGGNPEQVMFILHGRGANGKSTFVEVCSNVLGSYAKTAPSSVLIEGRGLGVGDDLVFLKGARWINASETGQGAYLAENKLKQITGGDTTAARALYADFQEFQLSGVVLFSTNHLPKVRGTDEGIWRRLNVIEFKRAFKEDDRDPHLKDTLLAEGSGVLNWMLEGHRQYKVNGLEPPACVQEATKRYRKDMDVVSGFLEEHCVFDPNASTNQTVLREYFDRYGNENGRGGSSWADLKAQLEVKGVTKRKVGGQRLWSGISLVK